MTHFWFVEEASAFAFEARGLHFFVQPLGGFIRRRHASLSFHVSLPGGDCDVEGGTRCEVLCPAVISAVARASSLSSLISWGSGRASLDRLLRAGRRAALRAVLWSPIVSHRA